MFSLPDVETPEVGEFADFLESTEFGELLAWDVELEAWFFRFCPWKPHLGGRRSLDDELGARLVLASPDLAADNLALLRSFPMGCSQLITGALYRDVLGNSLKDDALSGEQCWMLYRSKSADQGVCVIVATSKSLFSPGNTRYNITNQYTFNRNMP